jgi:hypothetical protein
MAEMRGEWTELREKLAAIEHEQWIRWAQTVAASEPIGKERRERWQRLMIPYVQLSEADKEHDRKWADKVLEILYEAGCLLPIPGA